MYTHVKIPISSRMAHNRVPGGCLVTKRSQVENIRKQVKKKKNRVKFQLLESQLQRGEHNTGIVQSMLLSHGLAQRPRKI